MSGPGVVRGGEEFDYHPYGEIYGVDRSAFMAGIHRAFQSSVDTSEDIRLMTATVKNTTKNMEDVDSAVGAIGNEFTTMTVNSVSKEMWVAKDDQEAADMAMALILAGQAPPALGADAAARSQQSVRFWRDANYPQFSPPAKWVETTGAASDVLIRFNGEWQYKGVNNQPIRSYDPSKLATELKQFTDETDLDKFPPGTLLKRANTSEYYMLAADKSLVPFPDPTQNGSLIAAVKQVDKDTALEWKKLLQSAHDQIVTISQTQTEYMLSLTGNLQNGLNMLTMLLKRFDRLMASLGDKV